MKIIDAHVHYSRIRAFEECAKHTSFVDYSRLGFSKESQEHIVVKSVCMGLVETGPGGFPDKSSPTPMIADLDADESFDFDDFLPPGMSLCFGINPHTLNNNSLAKIEALIKNSKKVVGIKIYAGYYHVDVNDPVYTPVYDLAEKYDKTIVIHTGETYSDRGLLKYSHPLCLDGLAVLRPDMRIVACHMGAPWVFDACEIASKNPNVYVDISGLLVGGPSFIYNQANNPLMLDRYRQALVFMNNYEKVIYGTDWPLASMGAYLYMCKKLIPPEFHNKVFYENAERVYKLC